MEASPSPLADAAESDSALPAALGIQYLPISVISPNPKQPRQLFLETELDELADSIRTLGVLQPILVRPVAGAAARYEIVAGERRWRASQRAGLDSVPVVVRSLDDRETLEISIVENVQRADLNPIEEARAYHRLAEEFNLSQQEIAEKVGKDRATVANSIRLLKLSPEVLELLRKGELSMGHARALLAIKDPTAQTSLAKKAVADALSVRAIEELVSRAVVLDAGKTMASDSTRRLGATERQFPELLDRLRAALGTKVQLRHGASGKGKIIVEYFSEAELDRLIERLTR